jgi:hypothetical protein
VTFWHRHAVSGETLSAYADGALDAPARARVDVHLDSCLACREALGELRAVRRSLRELPRERAPRSFALREADVLPAPRPAAMPFGRAPALLAGLAMTAFLAFGVLVGVDLSTGTGGDGMTSQLASERAIEDYGASDEPPVPATDPGLPAATPVPADLEEPAMPTESVQPAPSATPQRAEVEGPSAPAETALGSPAATPTPPVVEQPTAPVEARSDVPAATPLPDYVGQPDAGETNGREPAEMDGGTASDGEAMGSTAADGGGRTGLRIAEAAAAAVALVAAGSLLAVRRRGRA